MSSFCLYHAAQPRAGRFGPEQLARARDLMVARDGDREESFVEPDACGLVIRHPAATSTGLARDTARGLTLLLAGRCWRADRPERLLSAAELLDADACGRDGTGGVRGHYSFALLDGRTGTTTLEVSRSCVYPLYYARLGGTLGVATRLACLRDLSAQALDPEALAELLAYGYVATDRTLLAGVRLVPSGHRAVLRGDEIRLVTLPQPAPSRDRALDAGLLEGLRETFERGIARQCQGAQRATVFLSGGLDSRIAAAACQSAGLDARGLSVGEGFSLEVKVASRVAARLGLPCDSFRVDGRTFPDWFPDAAWVTEGRCPPGHMHYMQGALDGMLPRDPVIHGIAGEAVLGGFVEPPAGLTAPGALRDACVAAARAALQWPEAMRSSLFAPAIAPTLAAAPARVAEWVFDHIDSGDAREQYRRFVVRFHGLGFTHPTLFGQVVPWTEVVPVFLDPDFEDLAGTVAEVDLPQRRAQLRFALHAYPEACREPRVKDGVLIPCSEDNQYERGVRLYRLHLRLVRRLSLLTRGRVILPVRESFPSYNSWFMRHRRVRDYFHDILGASQSSGSGLWRADGVRRLLARFRRGEGLWVHASLLLLVEEFHRQYCRDGGPRALRLR